MELMSEAAKRSAAKLNSLSIREKEVLDRMLQGLTDDGIASSLGVSRNTIATYWVRIRSKLGPLTRAQIATLLLRVPEAQSVAGSEHDLPSRAIVILDSNSRVRAASPMAEALGFHVPLLALQSAPPKTRSSFDKVLLSAIETSGTSSFRYFTRARGAIRRMTLRIYPRDASSATCLIEFCGLDDYIALGKETIAQAAPNA